MSTEDDVRDAARYRILRLWKLHAIWPREFEDNGIGPIQGLIAWSGTADELDVTLDTCLGLVPSTNPQHRPDYQDFCKARTTDRAEKARAFLEKKK